MAPPAAGDVVYNPYLPGVLDDPYPHYRQLRSEAPVHWTPIGFWVFTRFADGRSSRTAASP